MRCSGGFLLSSDYSHPKRHRVHELLSDIAIHRGLANVPGWSRKQDTLVKTYQFKTFPAAISFV